MTDRMIEGVVRELENPKPKTEKGYMRDGQERNSPPMRSSITRPRSLGYPFIDILLDIPRDMHPFSVYGSRQNVKSNLYGVTISSFTPKE